MRKFIFLLLLFLAATFIYVSFAELESIADTLQRGNFWFMLLAILFELGWLVSTGYIILSLYRILGMDGTLYKMSLMFAAGSFVSTLMPSGGMSGVAVFISNARRNGQSAGKVTVASALFIFLDYVAFLCVLVLGLVVLFQRHDLDASEITASSIMFMI